MFVDCASRPTTGTPYRLARTPPTSPAAGATTTAAHTPMPDQPVRATKATDSSAASTTTDQVVASQWYGITSWQISTKSSGAAVIGRRRSTATTTAPATRQPA